MGGGVLVLGGMEESHSVQVTLFVYIDDDGRNKGGGWQRDKGDEVTRAALARIHQVLNQISKGANRLFVQTSVYRKYMENLPASGLALTAAIR